LQQVVIALQQLQIAAADADEVIAAGGGCTSSLKLRQVRQLQQQLKIAAGEVVAAAVENCSTRGDCSKWWL
jgi:hypothetical protein